ncbi:MAG TPA: hypothetical protein VGG10_07865 [Rhizomicrobium sp.]|jgi:hypothetical protein
MFRIAALAFFSALIWTAAANEAAAQSYTFRSVNLVPGEETILLDVKPLYLLGWALTSDSAIPTCYLQFGGARTVIADPKGVATYCHGVNSKGVVVGYYETGADVAVGFTYANGVYTDFSLPNGADGPLPISISDNGLITGYYYNNNVPFVFVIRNGNLVTFRIPGSTNIFPSGINNQRQILMQQVDTGGNLHGVLKTGPTMLTIAYPGATQTVVEKINNNGQLCGRYTASNGTVHGFVYDSVKTAYYNIDYPGAVETNLNGIDDNATLVGDFRKKAGGGRTGLRAAGALP